jgi:hypothetical protein
MGFAFGGSLGGGGRVPNTTNELPCRSSFESRASGGMKNGLHSGENPSHFSTDEELVVGNHLAEVIGTIPNERFDFFGIIQLRSFPGLDHIYAFKTAFAQCINHTDKPHVNLTITIFQRFRNSL